MKYTLIKLSQTAVLLVLCAGFTAYAAMELVYFIETGSPLALFSAAALAAGGFATWLVIVNDANPEKIRQSLRGEQAP